MDLTQLIPMGQIVRFRAGPLAGLTGPIIRKLGIDRWLIKPDAFREGAFVSAPSTLLELVESRDVPS